MTFYITFINMVIMEEQGKKEKHVRMIRDNIEKAQWENILKKTQEIKIKSNDYSGNFKKEAGIIIDHIKKAHAEIYIIENMENKALKSVNKNINNRILEIFPLVEAIIKYKEDKIKELKKIISNLIEDTGPKKDATFLLLNVKRKGINYILRHSINVCLISIATAIELTKIMTEKLNDDSVKGDFKKLDICNRKIFNKEELIKLGVAALVHDIGLLESFPDLNEETKFGIKDKSKIELHTNNAYHLLTQLNVDYDIRQAVLQHHEMIDGTGFPDNIKGRLMSKYSMVLSLSNEIERLTSKNPFIKKLHPHNAIMKILTRERNKFDNDSILAFCRAASIYPIGSWLSLSNNKIGLVFKTNKKTLKKPIVKCVYTSDMKELLKKEFIDLSKSDLTINELIDIEALELIDKNVEKFIFDEREFIRIPVNIKAKINIINSGIFYDSKVTDISSGGARLELDEELKLGDEILLNFNHNNRDFNDIKSLIVWSDGKHAKENHYGLRFLNINEDSREFLMDLT